MESTNSVTPITVGDPKPNTNNSINHKKKTSDTALKSCIIEFMRERPFLWNSKHPSYKDHKRREHEFQAFSNQIGTSVQEIKRVWHVLRTNFFRAHKLILERPHNANNSENGEKLWKYYLAMDYILEGTRDEIDHKDAMHMKSMKQNTTRAEYQRGLKRELNNNTSGSSSRNSTSCMSCSSNSSSKLNNSCVSIHSTNHSSTLNKSLSFNETSIENDDDHLYARSLTSTLKKFDPTTKEIIKLKFQEIIVSYMQQQADPHQSSTNPQSVNGHDDEVVMSIDNSNKISPLCRSESRD